MVFNITQLEHDGSQRTMDIEEEAGAREYVRRQPLFLANICEQIASTTDDRRRCSLAGTIRAVGSSLSPEALGGMFPAEQKRAFQELACAGLRKEAKKKAWRTRGELSPFADEALSACGQWSKDLTFLDGCFAPETPIGAVIAELFTACVKPERCGQAFDSLVDLMGNACITLLNQKRSLEPLAECGLVSHFLRMVAFHPADERSVGIVNFLRDDLRLVRKRIRVEDINMEGADPTLLAKLKQLKAQVELSANKPTHELSGNKPIHIGRLCRYCSAHEDPEDREQKKMLQCSQCHFAFYCNKDCQRADWKAGHKATCKKEQGSNQKTEIKTINTTLMNFVQTNYGMIRFKLASKAGGEFGMKQMAALVDFENASSTAQSFSVVLVADMLNERNLPDWFYKGTEVYRENVDGFKGQVRAVHAILEPGQLLVIARIFGGGSTVHRLTMFSGAERRPLFSEETLRGDVATVARNPNSSNVNLEPFTRLA